MMRMARMRFRRPPGGGGPAQRLPGRISVLSPRCLLRRPVHYLLSPQRRPGSRSGRCMRQSFPRPLAARRAGVKNQDRGNGEQLSMEESDGAVIAGSLETPGAFGIIFDRHGSTLLRSWPAASTRLRPRTSGRGVRISAAVGLRRVGTGPARLSGIAANVVPSITGARSAASGLARALRPPAGQAPVDRAAAAAGRRPVGPGHGCHGTLPEAERQVLLLFAWEELSYDEIAAALGVPVGTVRSRLSRARTRLAALTRGRDTAADVPPTPYDAGAER